MAIVSSIVITDDRVVGLPFERDVLVRGQRVHVAATHQVTLLEVLERMGLPSGTPIEPLGRGHQLILH